MQIDSQNLRKILKNYVPSSSPLGFGSLGEKKETSPVIPAAVLVGLQFFSNEWHLLLTKRSAHLEDHAGQISFPGGRMDDTDGNLQHTALREAEEEIGLLAQNVEIIGKLQNTLVAQKFLVTPYVGLVSTITPSINPIEVEEFFYVPLSFFLKDAHCFPDHRYPKYNGDQFHYEDKNIWGGTASIILNLKQILKNAS